MPNRVRSNSVRPNPVDSKTVRLGRFLSYVLRHNPAKLGLDMDAGGWVAVDDLIAGMRTEGYKADRGLIVRVVAEDDKQRFAFDETGDRIRASQGHSVDVDLGLAPLTPPDRLYHGTVAAVLERIAAEGLRPMGRRHVHLSPDKTTARSVGGRRGRPVVLEIESGRMHRAGRVFFRSANGVWLTDAAPPEFIVNPDDLRERTSGV